MSSLIDFIRKAPITTLIGADQKSKDLFHLIQSEKVLTKEEVAKAFYEKTMSRSMVYELLGKLESDVVNSIIQENPSTIPLRANYRYVHRMECAVKLLDRQGDNELAVYLAEKVLKKSILYEFTDLTLSLAETCRYYFAITGHRKKFEYYLELCTDTAKVMNLEKKAEGLHDQLVFAISQKKSNYDQEERLAQEIYDELTPAIEKSNRIMVIWGVVGVILYSIKNDHQEGSKICKQVLNHLLPQSDTVYLSWIFTFLFHLVPSQLKSDKAKDALQYIQEIEKNSQLQRYNKIVLQQYKFIVAMHAQQLDLSADSIQALQKMRLNELQKEIFEVHQSYQLLLEGKPLRLARFLNQVPTYSKDKEGMNINIIIIQLLYLIREGKLYAFCDRSPGIQRYLHRYLKSSPNKRSTFFIQSLLELETSGFDRKKIDRIKSIKKLEKYPYQESPQDFDIEIVPYEILWQEAMAWL
ncbi:MAG: hypothetical protein MK226_00390 [Saprospiraceae bacterium]|jgi:hypothetical protein|nr:hypothetical protein [Saprospiraceae bacterium]